MTSILSTENLPGYNLRSNHKPVRQDPGPEPSETKQEFKNDCDINHILSKYQRTGALDHYARYAPMYGDFTSLDYQTSLNLIKNAENMFAALPSSIRDRFQTPAEFLDFVQDPSNRPEMDRLGLTTGPLAINRPPSEGDVGAFGPTSGEGDTPSPISKTTKK